MGYLPLTNCCCSIDLGGISTFAEIESKNAWSVRGCVMEDGGVVIGGRQDMTLTDGLENDSLTFLFSSHKI